MTEGTKTDGGFGQFLRYASVGLIANLTGYLVYLLLTALLFGPKLAMTLVYVTGVVVSYLGNSKWTFVQNKAALPTAIKYGLAHVCGYMLNFVLLYVFVDRIGYPDEFVQAVAIIIVACFLFIVFKTLVFA